MTALKSTVSQVLFSKVAVTFSLSCVLTFLCSYILRAKGIFDMSNYAIMEEIK